VAPPIQPGRGANLVGQAASWRYVYAALSRRAAGTSLGVDLTSAGQCSLACIYCQVPRTRRTHGRPVIDIATLQRELAAMLRSPPTSGWAEVCVAGSGEPTLAANLEAALETVLDAAAKGSFDGPMRLYTNGLHLAAGSVRHAMAKWTNASGELWVKLDALTQETCTKLWRRHVAPAEHVARIWSFARQVPIGIQTMIMTGAGLPRPETLARQLAAVLSWGLATGAKFHGIQLIAPTRPAGDPAALRAARVTPASAQELEAAKRVLEAELRLPVQIFA
jgi:wyosine [tRNA(Phe)-imidazoG37] synthetase (radical SAM superfamily)